MTANSSSKRLPLPPYLRRESERQLPEIQAAIARVCASGRFLFGDELTGFETELAASVDRLHAVGVGSGTDALHLALRALGVGPGDDVATQSHSSPFTVIAIHMAGARPILIDSLEDDFGMDPKALERSITPRTKVVLPVHLYGHPVRIQEICEIAARARAHVIEDCAQAQGARVQGRPVGTFGTVGCFSFYPTKNLGSLGDGGAIVTNDNSVADRVRVLRNGGMIAHGIHADRGITSRLNEIQASVLRLRLPHLEAANEARRAHAAGYAEALADWTIPTLRDGCHWAPHQFVVRHPDRDAIRSAAAAEGVPLLVHYPLPIHLQEGLRSPDYPPGSLPVAERLAAEVLSLPTHPDMSPDDRNGIVSCVRQAVATHPNS